MYNKQGNQYINSGFSGSSSTDRPPIVSKTNGQYYTSTKTPLTLNYTWGLDFILFWLAILELIKADFFLLSLPKILASLGLYSRSLAIVYAVISVKGSL